MFQQISILGPGLLGASLALAMKERGLCQRVHSWSRRAETRLQAMQADWCDAVFDQACAACEASDLVVVCTPVETIIPLIEQVTPSLSPEALVTDVGSIKGLICREAQSLKVNFIGSHPMAGSERTGMAHANHNLFDGAAFIVSSLAFFSLVISLPHAGKQGQPPVSGRGQGRLPVGRSGVMVAILAG